MSDKFSTIDERASYGIGLQMGQQLAGQPFEGMQNEAVLAGIADALNGRPSQVSHEDLNEAIEDLNQRIMSQREEEAGELAAAGKQFLEENAKRAEVEVSASGLQYEILQSGEGDKPAMSSRVRVHYHGTLPDGSVFDSSVERGEPVDFPVSGVIAGWTEALQMMSPGAKWKLYVPHQLAYGEKGAGGVIQPYATLIFEVELLEIL